MSVNSLSLFFSVWFFIVLFLFHTGISLLFLLWLTSLYLAIKCSIFPLSDSINNRCMVDLRDLGDNVLFLLSFEYSKNSTLTPSFSV